jgi:hypothetical protein
VRPPEFSLRYAQDAGLGYRGSTIGRQARGNSSGRFGCRDRSTPYNTRLFNSGLRSPFRDFLLLRAVSPKTENIFAKSATET